MKEVIQELSNADRFLDEDYKRSNYYREYLDTVFKELKQNTYE